MGGGGTHLGDQEQFWKGDCSAPHRVGECYTVSRAGCLGKQASPGEQNRS